jgi:hypothetical protein
MPSDPEFSEEFNWVHTVWKRAVICYRSLCCYLCSVLARYDETGPENKRRKIQTPVASPVKPAMAVVDQGFDEGPFGPSYAIAEQSVKLECGCCFDDQCSFVSRTHTSDIVIFIFASRSL